MEDRVVEVPALGERDERCRRVRSELGVERHGERAAARVERERVGLRCVERLGRRVVRLRRRAAPVRPRRRTPYRRWSSWWCPSARRLVVSPPQPAANASARTRTRAARIACDPTQRCRPSRAASGPRAGTSSMRRLPRRGVGHAVARRPPSLRDADARRRAGGPLVVDDPAQARRLSARVRRLRSGRRRALHAERTSSGCSPTRASCATG